MRFWRSDSADRTDSSDSIHDVGSRAFVGGDGKYWKIVGNLQYYFLLDRGLKTSDVLIDIGCGSLRGGIRFIKYLEPGHYLGFDKFIELIIYGVMNELGRAEFRRKRPHFVVSSYFEFDRFTSSPTFGIAQSLFSHLNRSDILSCLNRLRAITSPAGCRLFATFNEASQPVANETDSNSWGYFRYTPAEMKEFGDITGWDFSYIGDWGHPRQQKIVEYRARPHSSLP